MGIADIFGTDIAWHAENDKWAAKVLAHHHPNVPNLGDITTIDWSDVDPVDVVCAGFPCTPVSRAGKRKVTGDERWIWEHVAECVRVLRPRHVVVENVDALLVPWRDGRWWRPAPVETVLGDLAALGYDTCWRSVRASDVGACHRRERVFIVATDTVPRRTGGDGRAVPREAAQVPAGHTHVHAPGDARPVASDGRPGWGRYAAAIAQWEQASGRRAPAPVDRRGQLAPVFVEWMMGLPQGWVTGVDISRSQMLRILGNGVVPQQAAYAVGSIVARAAA